MNTAQIIINATLTLLLPILIGLTYWVTRLALERLPSQNVMRLKFFARMAVRSIEQQFEPSQTKKALAEAEIMMLYSAFKFPLPDKKAINDAIEAEVYNMNNKLGE